MEYATDAPNILDQLKLATNKCIHQSNNHPSKPANQSSANISRSAGTDQTSAGDAPASSNWFDAVTLTDGDNESSSVEAAVMCGTKSIWTVDK